MLRNQLIGTARTFLRTNGWPTIGEYSGHYLSRAPDPLMQLICPACHAAGQKGYCILTMDVGSLTVNTGCVVCKQCDTFTCWPMPA
jgi:hypothetical protein